MGNCWSSKSSGPSSAQYMASFTVRTSECYINFPGSEEEILLSVPNCQAFSFTDLRNATSNFRPESILGKGGFGYVYKGWIDEQRMVPTKPGSGIVVAVKMLNQKGSQGHREWLAEVIYLGKLHHPNLVNLLGYCKEDDRRLLVYEFMEEESLEKHLFKKDVQPLSWATRMKVAVGAARALAFLHNADRPVMHCDFKSSNILLDSNYNPKLSDFGLARHDPTGVNTHVSTTAVGTSGDAASDCKASDILLDWNYNGPISDKTHVSTGIVGTSGYAAPEHMITGSLTAKSDVYSFGVVLLELLSGRRAVENNKPIAEQNLVEWAKPCLSDKRKLTRVMDTRLENRYKMKEAHKAATIALHCVNSKAKERPLMTQIVETLEQLQKEKNKAKFSQPDRSGPK